LISYWDLIASSRADQTSSFFHSDRNSLFTKHLLAGLRGAAGHDEHGYVRVFDLFTYTAEMVRRDDPRQIPDYSAHQQEDNFPVTYCHNQALRKSRVFETPFATSRQDAASLTGIFAALYPLGPRDLSIWERAGGDLSRLRLGNSGRTEWFDAIRQVVLGGGGAGITIEKLVHEALVDYPRHRQLDSMAAIT